jgi:hypothetical protein
MEPARGRYQTRRFAPRESAAATASRRPQVAPLGYTFGRGSRRAASLRAARGPRAAH